MSEQLGVLCYTTVAGGGYTAGSGVLNVGSTSTGSGILPFPGSGTFSVVIADPITFAPKALLEVTGINSATQFAVTNSGGVDVSCLAGDLVQAVIDGRALSALIGVETSWTALPYQNGWTDFGSGFQTGQYMRDRAGLRVWFRGVLARGTNTPGTLLWIMPVGFRPVAPTLVFGFNDNGANGIAIRLGIAINGEVTLTYASSSTYLNLEGVSFSLNA